NACESPAAIRPARSISSARALATSCVPGIADLYEWVVTLDARRLASVPALAAPCPLPSVRRCRCDASCDDSIELNASNHSGASKRGEPRREGRLWRSRRKSGSRGEESLGRRRSRAGYPLADTVCATRSPSRSGSPRFETIRARRKKATHGVARDELRFGRSAIARS